VSEYLSQLVGRLESSAGSRGIRALAQNAHEKWMLSGHFLRRSVQQSQTPRGVRRQQSGADTHQVEVALDARTQICGGVAEALRAVGAGRRVQSVPSATTNRNLNP